MRRILFSALMISLLFLSACSKGEGGNGEKFSEFRERLEAASSIGMTAEIRADYGETVDSYEMSFYRTADASTVEVLAPELLAGVKANIGSDPMTVEFEGVILETGSLGTDALSPITALAAMTDALISGHIEYVWNEKNNDAKTIAAEILISESCTLTVWLSYDSLTPLYAEISNEGNAVIFCTVKNWQIN